MEWSDLRYFLVVAREGRLLAAGRALGVQHTTVARRIDALERSLEAKLFHRTSRGWRLTPLGERVRENAETMEREAHLVSARARQEASELRGRVRIAMPESFAWAWVTPRLGELHARYPRIQIELVTGNPQLDLTRGEADLAVRTPRPKQRELASVLLAEGGIALFATRALARKHEQAFSTWPPRGDRVPLGVYHPDLDFLQRAPWFPAFVAQADVRFVTTSTMALLAAAKSGAVVAPMVRFVAKREPSLVEVGRGHLTSQKIWLVTHPEVRRDPRVTAVAEFLKEIAREVDERR